MAKVSRLAVLIDGENISATVAEKLFAEIAKIGDAAVRRVYGNRCQLQGWTKVQAKYGIKSRKNKQHARKKNTTDATLIVEAVTLLHLDELDGFCIVSSDSDFAALAQYIRSKGKRVYGFGETKASKCLRDACRKYVDLKPTSQPLS